MTQQNDPLERIVTAYADAFSHLAGATTGRTRRGAHGSVLAVSGAPTAALNMIVSTTREASVEEIIELADTERLGEEGPPWSIRVRGVPGPEVTAVAARYGLTRHEREPLMLRHSDQGVPNGPTPKDFHVRAVPVDELHVYARTVADGFEAPPELFQVLADPAVGNIDGMTFYLAELGGVPVGTGMTATAGDVAGIFNITTLPEFRRRGYGRATVSEMVRAGHMAGAATSYLYAWDMGRRVYESLGFRTEEYLTVITAPD